VNVRTTGCVLSLESVLKITVSSIWVPKASANTSKAPVARVTAVIASTQRAAGRRKYGLFGPG
jgi:hypothetical protein